MTGPVALDDAVLLPAPVDEELLLAVDELLLALEELLLAVEELLLAVLDTLDVPDPPAPVLLLELAAVLLELLPPVEPLLELEAALLELLVVVPPGPAVTEAWFAPPKPPAAPVPLFPDSSSPEKPFAQATAMTIGQTAQKSFKMRTSPV